MNLEIVFEGISAVLNSHRSDATFIGDEIEVHRRDGDIVVLKRLGEVPVDD